MESDKNQLLVRVSESELGRTLMDREHRFMIMQGIGKLGVGLTTIGELSPIGQNRTFAY